MSHGPLKAGISVVVKANLLYLRRDARVPMMMCPFTNGLWGLSVQDLDVVYLISGQIQDEKFSIDPTVLDVELWLNVSRS